MALQEKVDKAIDVVKHIPMGRPVVMSSFGKDSMVLLDIVKKAGFKWPVLSFREPFFPEKYEFANRQILENGYSVYDYPPLYTAVNKKDGVFEVSNFYQVGDEVIFCPTGIVAPKDGEQFLCGLYDLLNKPTGTYKFPWDTVLLGHKASDTDPMLGHCPIDEFVVQSGPLTAVFPLKDFTDADVWEYHSEFFLPVHHQRYENGRELSDKSRNPDYFPACMACVDRDGPPLVFCPKVGLPVQNISGVVKYSTVQKPFYVR